MPQMRASSKFARTSTGTVDAGTNTAPLAFCDVIGWPPSSVPTAPCGRISACFWMLAWMLFTKTVRSVRQRGAVADAGLVLQARLRLELLDRLAGGHRRRVGGRADEAVEPGDVGRRDLEAGAGQAERAEIGHVRRAEAAADRQQTSRARSGVSTPASGT